VDLAGRLARVVPVAALVATAPWLATRNDAEECTNVGVCLGQHLDQAVVWLPLLPVAWLTLRLLKVDHAALTTLAAGAYGALGWQLMRSVQHGLDPAASSDAPPPVWAAWLVGGLAGALATVVLAAPGRGWVNVVLAVGAPLVLLGLLRPVGTWSDEQGRLERVDQVAAAPVTLYRPVISGVVPRAYPSQDGVFLSYTIGAGAESTYPSVRLLPTAGGDLCATLADPLDPCTSDGTTMRAGTGEYVEVAVVRGDTTLHAQSLETATLDVDTVVEALRTAPVVSADDLVS
jgi:hypothetical protein